MKIPATIPHFKTAAGFTLAYALVWMALEGELWRDLLLAGAVVALAIASLLTRFLGGHALSAIQLIAIAAAAGLIAGVALPLVTLFLMALKTGIHAHGPEYTSQEIAWVWRQLPLWALVGGITGFGLGLLSAARRA